MKSIVVKGLTSEEATKTKVYQQKLEAKYGYSNVKAAYIKCDVPIPHVCESCTKDFLASPTQMLSYKTYATCVACSNATRAKKQSVSQIDFEKKLSKKFGGITCIEFFSNHRKAKFKCSCSHEWENKPYELLKLKHGCPECAQRVQTKAQTYSAKDIVTLFKQREIPISVIGKRKQAADRCMQVQCNSCSHIWNGNIGNILNSATRCPACAKRKAINPTTKSIKLNKKNVCVQGSEDVAIRFLIEKKKVKESRIHVFSEGKVEVIEYDFNGARKEYWPDIRVGKTLVEVKSIYTLGVDWEKNIAKAKACIKQGFKFKLFLVNKGKTYVLPADWIKWKVEQAYAFLRTKTLKSLRILSLDPGVTNFAWSVLEINRPFEVKLIATGMVQNTLKDLTSEVQENIQMFGGEIREIVEEYRIDHMIMERFMARGMKGTTIELVNIMIGYLAASWRVWRKRKKRSFKLLTAAQWKNEWNRRSDLKEFYKKASCEVHQVDAIGIGIYGGAFWFDAEPFKDIKVFEKELLKQIEIADVTVKKESKNGNGKRTTRTKRKKRTKRK